MSPSKSKVDRAGYALATQEFRHSEEWLELEDVFDEYRKAHLEPLSETTLELQQLLLEHEGDYYIAQRLKRKPQIIRKLNRLSTRLTQLQDIGGCRIIVKDNRNVDRLLEIIKTGVKASSPLKLIRRTDYRERGRDITGYRAVHLILERSGRRLELQIRSSIQHYWAESIERTSVIYGRQLKENEGAPEVISYFRRLSDAFYEYEAGRRLSPRLRIELAASKIQAESEIRLSPNSATLHSKVNEDIIKVLVEKEKRNAAPINNWILIFDWNTGQFVSWDIVGRSPEEAIRSYVEYENLYPAEKNFEVVLIGSSNVATVRRTHSHYFGIEDYDRILETLDESIALVAESSGLGVGEKQILLKLQTKRFWGKKSVSQETLRNHFCKDVSSFDDSLKKLVERNLVLRDSHDGPVSLNIKMRGEIEKIL